MLTGIITGVVIAIVVFYVEQLILKKGKWYNTLVYFELKLHFFMSILDDNQFLIEKGLEKERGILILLPHELSMDENRIHDIGRIDVKNKLLSLTLNFTKYNYEEENYISSVIEYRNITNRDNDALAITMIYYDAFNEKADGVRGIATDLMGAGKGYRGTWSTYGEPNFVKTAMAFVDAVRFVDGEIWKADRQEVIEVAGKMPELYFLSKTEMLEVEKK